MAKDKKNAKTTIKKTIKKIVKQERGKAIEERANGVKDWESKYIDRLTDRIYDELTSDEKDDAKID